MGTAYTDSRRHEATLGPARGGPPPRFRRGCRQSRPVSGVCEATRRGREGGGLGQGLGNSTALWQAGLR
jgi:hypothetical protein